MNLPAACISLTLVSRPQTLTLVRTMLSGFADALALDPELLDDLKTAVSEACNNVVMHAYPDSDDGRLEVVLRLDGPDLVAEVRDDGIGIDELRLLDAAEVGLGIPVIRALAADTDLHRRTDGGTQVTMRFPAERDGTPLYLLPGPVAAEDGFAERLRGEAVVSASPPAVVGSVLGRLARAMAATAHFSLDRFSDVYLVCDALAASVGTLAASGRLACSVDTVPKRLVVQVGPLQSGSGRRLAEEPGRDATASPLERLSDELRAESANGAGEVLEVVMIDQRA